MVEDGVEAGTGERTGVKEGKKEEWKGWGEGGEWREVERGERRQSGVEGIKESSSEVKERGLQWRGKKESSGEAEGKPGRI